MDPKLTIAEAMQRALEIAREGQGNVSPNPLVGCVLLSADGEVLGQGAHLAYGGPHAEVNAVADAKSNGVSLEGATAVITLEPCSHFGKTPPCARLLIESGIARCVVAMADPNPIVAGAGIRALREAGIAVEVGMMEREARVLTRFFSKHIATGSPFITLKIAQSIDGRIALASGESRWITSEASRRVVHRMRAEHDAVLIGPGTAAADDPLLNVRLVAGRSPSRIILDPHLALPGSLKVFGRFEEGTTYLVTTSRAAAECPQRIGELRASGVEVLFTADDSQHIDLVALFSDLGGRGIQSILTEAGPGLARHMLSKRIFDELALFIAPIVLGQDAMGAVGSLGLQSLSSAPSLRLEHVETIEGSSDILALYSPYEQR